MKSAKTVFGQYLKEKGMLLSKQRQQILDVFLGTKRHLTIEDIYELVRKRNSKIGIATVYRAMRVIRNCGLATEVDFGDGVRRFEHKYRHQHHHHLVCIKCGRVIEVTSNQVEKLQKKLAGQHNFAPTRDTMRIFGICSRCQRNNKHGS